MRFILALFTKRPKPPEPEPRGPVVRVSLAPRASGRTRGFTLIELMIVLAIIAIIAAIAIPNLLAARINSNETATIATLRTLVSAQAQFRATGKADENNNGVGEHGTFGEMSGGVTVRGNALLKPTVLSTAFANINANGETSRNGYLYAVYLPDVNGLGLAEEAGGGADANVDADLSESVWCVYAWPSVYGQSGNRTYFVNQGGDVTYTEENAYSATGQGPPSNSAFDNTGTQDTITGNVAVGSTGRDGNFWRSAG